MRGLKQNQLYTHCRPHQVASFTDAWIETISDFWKVATKEVASFTDAWIETPLDNISATDMLVASFTDAWIETQVE